MILLISASHIPVMKAMSLSSKRQADSIEREQSISMDHHSPQESIQKKKKKNYLPDRREEGTHYSVF
jgi:hypothetical protein